MAEIDLVALITVLASTGVLTFIATGARGLARSISGRERHEQVSVKALKAERDEEWRRRIRLGDAYARTRQLALQAGADPAELAMIDRLVEGIYEEGME